MHSIDRNALLATIIGASSFAGSVLSLGIKLPLSVTIILLALGAAGQAASQYLRISGAPSTNKGQPNAEH